MADYDRRTALLVVDMQNDFSDPDGSLYVRGGEEIIDGINAEIARARGSAGVIVYTQDWHPPSTPHFAKDGGIWPVHCVHDTWGAELHPRLTREPNVAILHKGTGGEDGYSTFTVRDPRTGEQRGTSLQDRLESLGIGKVVIAGIATDYCVKESALDALKMGFSVAVSSDLVRAVDLEEGSGDRALDDIRRAGATVT